jgi:RimJ/RimL family protein N-acetyltransferase
MKYSTTFKNKHGDEFSVSSMDDYEMSEKDLSDFTHVLSDDPVRNYITDEAMNRWGHATPESLAEDILSHSRVRWEESKELRFLMRDKEGVAIGMIGVTLKEGRKSGELWYYKTSKAPSCMYEALKHVLPFLRSEGLMELSAEFELDNQKSIHILQKLGFKDSQKEGEMHICL